MQIYEDRKALHQIPELDRALPKTMDYLKHSLSGLKCQVFSPLDSSICALFDFGAPDAIAFRCDMDAVPIQECTRLPFASQHPGRMHAAGHDGHMAILLELARQLDKEEKLPHNVLLVFQPSEETTGGAKDLCATGVFKKNRVKAIFGLHLWPGLEAGALFSRKDAMMSRSCEVTVDIQGKSSHLARADEGMDALAAGVEFYKRVTAMEAALPKRAARLLNFGKFESGTVRNAISAGTHMEGSLRAFQDSTFYSLRAEIVAIGNKIERSSGCSVSVYMNDGYPAVVNPPALYEKVKNAVEFRELAEPSLVSDDFSWYQKTLPGMYFFLGTGNSPALHTGDFDFPMEVLPSGVNFFLNLAKNFR